MNLIFTVSLPIAALAWIVWLIMNARRVRRNYRAKLEAFERECVEKLDVARALRRLDEMDGRNGH